MTTTAFYVPAKFKTMLDNMNLLDRFLFNETVEDPEVYRMIVEIILGENISTFTQTETEKEFGVSPQLKQIRLYFFGTNEEGLAKGIAEGELALLVRQVCRKFSKGLSPEQIADHLETDIEQIIKICSVASSCAPDYDTERIVNELMNKTE